MLDDILKLANLLSRGAEVLIDSARELAAGQGLSPQEFEAKRLELDKRDQELTDQAKAALAAMLLP